MITMNIDTLQQELETMHDVVIPKPVIDDILRYGSNTTSSRMILLNLFAKGYTTDYVAERLPAIYHGGYGIVYNGVQYSAWYDADGIRMNIGSSARHSLSVQFIPWDQASRIIDALIVYGRFAIQQEVNDAPAFERKSLAQSLWYMYRDIDAGYNDMLSAIGQCRGGGFPDETARLAGMLENQSILAEIITQMYHFVNVYNSDPSIMRFRYHKPRKLLESIEALLLDSTYHDSTIIANEPQSFITDDEINAALGGGSSVSGGKLRIFRFITRQDNTRKRVEFMKREYGIGGHSHAVSGSDHSDESHDASGIKLNKQGCVTVNLPYTAAIERIEAMIQMGEYLNDAQLMELASSEYKCMEIDEFIDTYASESFDNESFDEEE